MIRLYNSMTRQVEDFVPRDPKRVTMYVCGPTVYSRPHVGNARPAVVFDVLRNLLNREYDYGSVVAASNFTDVDDKIIAAAIARGVEIDEITREATEWYQADMKSLWVTQPDFQPRATESIDAMIEMILELIRKGHAYEVNGEVLFWVPSNPHHGLAQHAENALRPGERVDVVEHKRDARDFVLWKPAKPGEPSWDSPWGKGRPGWHIECSAMIKATLGETIDIHGGGQDLRFPHHDAECAQSHCANDAPLANYWMHSGLLTIDGHKMSKSLGNIVLLGDLLERYPGEVIRYFFLQTHYRSPIDLTEAALQQAQASLDTIYEAMAVSNEIYWDEDDHGNADDPVVMHDSVVADILAQDLNTPKALQFLDGLAKKVIEKKDTYDALVLEDSLALLGLKRYDHQIWFQGAATILNSNGAPIQSEIEYNLLSRLDARRQKNWAASDTIRDFLINKYAVEIKDEADGYTWRFQRRAQGAL